MRQEEKFPKIIMIFNNNHCDFLPNLLQLGALYCETVENLHYSEGQGDVLPPPHSPSRQLYGSATIRSKFLFIGGQKQISFNPFFACFFTFYILYIVLNQLVL